MFQAGKVTGKRLKTRISMVQLGAMNIWMWMQHKVGVEGSRGVEWYSSYSPLVNCLEGIKIQCCRIPVCVYAF